MSPKDNVTVTFVLTLLHSSCLPAQEFTVAKKAWNISGLCLVPTHRQPRSVREYVVNLWLTHNKIHRQFFPWVDFAKYSLHGFFKMVVWSWVGDQSQFANCQFKTHLHSCFLFFPLDHFCPLYDFFNLKFCASFISLFSEEHRSRQLASGVT